MNSAQTYLKEVFGVDQVEEKPEGIHGILETTNYNDFLIVDDLGKEIYRFSGAKYANKCLSGDIVCWKENKCFLELRTEHPPIVGTLALSSKTRYGLTSKGVPIYLFVPYDKSYPNFIVGCSMKDVTQNRIGIVTFSEWKDNSTFPRGNLQELLGITGDWEAEYQALIWQACPWKWPKESYPIKQESTKRHVLDGFTFNIDPEGCKDIDDVFTIKKLNNSTYQVAISISDVASYVEMNGGVDIFASLIGQTLYNNKGMVIRSMLPVEYSEEVCSLRPGKVSYGITLQFEWNGETISKMEWLETEFVNQYSYTYDEFQKSISEYKDVLANIASYLAKTEVVDSHEWVEQMMIFYNKEAGRWLKDSNMGILRRHSTPEWDRLEKYKSHIPELMMLAFSSAEYCLAEEKETMHFGLDSDHYAHVSSPIRRYADLVNQRVLKILIQQSKDYFIVPQSMLDMNKREKAIKRFGRDMEFLEAIQHNRKECRGIIMDKIAVNENEYKIRVYIPSWKRMISTTYQKLSEQEVLSRDEKEVIDVTDFKEVLIQYALCTNLTNWKERIVITIKNLNNSDVL